MVNPGEIASLIQQRNDALKKAAEISKITAQAAALEVPATSAIAAGKAFDPGSGDSPAPAPGAISPTSPARTSQVPTPGANPTNGRAATAAAHRSQLPGKIQGTPPIQKQHRDLRGQPDYSPVKIAILNGKHNGAIVDLGFQPQETGHEESYNWQPQDSDGIRPGLNFKNIGNREISLTITYFDLNHDISHLVENLKHVAEITDGEKTPPRLLYLQGDLRGVECVCTKFSDKYSDPLPNSRGYRRCEVSITLLLNGGLNNANSLGGPLATTPLNDLAARSTQAERQRRGLQSRIELLMANCLGPDGSQALQSLIESNQQNDVAAIAKLDPNTFVQAAIAGIFTPEMLQSERLKVKLRASLALVLGQNTDGIANTPDARAFSEALASGDGAMLRSRIRDEWRSTQPDFEKILDSIQSQALDESAELFDRNQNPTAGKRLFEFGACGLDLRRNGASSLSQAQKEDALQLSAINKFFAGKPSDDEIKMRFGLETEGQIKRIRNGQPYQDKEQFLRHNSQAGQTAQAHAAWSNFTDS